MSQCQLIAQNEERQCYAVTLTQLDEFELPFESEAFPCLIWDHVGGWEQDERVPFARMMIRRGCRYAVCGGVACGDWDTAFDLAFVQDNLDVPEHVSQNRFVMTSMHDGESFGDVATFFACNTNFDMHDFRRFLVVHIGSGPGIEELNAAVAKHVASAA